MLIKTLCPFKNDICVYVGYLILMIQLLSSRNSVSVLVFLTLTSKAQGIHLFCNPGKTYALNNAFQFLAIWL